VTTAALFVPCYVDTLFPETGVAMVRLLERLGIDVDFPEAQTCCGQMHVNTGYQREVVPLLRRFVDVFGAADAVVAPSASCVATVRHMYPGMAQRAGDPALQADVAALLPRVRELSEFLIDDLGVEDVGAAFPHAVTFHPTCHSVRMLGVGDRPLRLLRRVRGIRLRELPRSDQCCGFGGTFAVKNADVSAAMLADKVADVLHADAEVVVAADDSCLMHIGGGLARQRTGVRTMHLAQVLATTEERAA
jgi:L-lactate dehydrogenase complex protein LldE